ncbi:MAG: hypothetical protein K2X93_28785 [Candidatus Obscuribacterales bacterium]|nr:hypothetical protein [Candidatus Obscuribacterales bacterium]
MVRSVEKIPGAAQKKPGNILAMGEITGHSHRVKGESQLFELDGQLFLRVLSDTATLTHEEHGPISLPKGEYLVWRQREYSPQELRVITD